MAGLVACVADALPGALASAKAARKLVDLAKGLPLFNAGAIECRLGPDGARRGADLSVSAFRDAPALPAVIADGRLKSPEWRCVRRFLRDWLAPGSPLAGRAGNVWLEFDAARVTRVSAPSMFFSLPLGSTKAAMWPLARHGLNLLAPECLAGGREAGLKAAMDAIEPYSRIVHVAVMLPRDVRVVRFEAMQVPVEHRAALLRDLEWPGDVAAFEEQTAWIAAFRRRALLNIAVGPDESGACRVLSRLGFEANFLGETPESKRGIVETLTRKGLATAEQGEGILEWDGGLRWHHGGESGGLLGGMPERILTEALHVKLVFEPGRRVYAKTYLGFRRTGWWAL